MRALRVVMALFALLIWAPAYADPASAPADANNLSDKPFVWVPKVVTAITRAGSQKIWVSERDVDYFREGDNVSVDACRRCSTVLSRTGTVVELDAPADLTSVSAQVTVGLARYKGARIVADVIGTSTILVGAAARGYGDWAGLYDGPGRWPDVSPLKVISLHGGRAATFASRLSDNPREGGLTTTETLAILTVQDRKPSAQFGGGWGIYTQANLLSPAAPTIAGLGFIQHEDSILNQWASPALDPYTTNATGYSENFRPDCGIGAGSSNNCSAAIHIINNGGRYRAGIIFSADALDTRGDSAMAPALALGPWQGIAWYSSAGKVVWSIYSSGRAGSHHVQLRDWNDNGDIFVDSSSITLSSAAGSEARQLNFKTDDVLRWQLAVTNGGAHPGREQGNLVLRRFADSGAYRGTPFSVDRSTGMVTMSLERLEGTAFADLPKCDSGATGAVALVIDSVDEIVGWHQRITSGGGHAKAFVQCLGDGWRAF